MGAPRRHLFRRAAVAALAGAALAMALQGPATRAGAAVPPGVVAGGPAAFGGAAAGVAPPTNLSAPIVGMAAAPGGGYWLVASDGGVFAYDGARFYGSTGRIHLAKPIVGMAAAPGGGYWLVASDGGVFSFGAARFHGSTGAIHLAKPIVGMAAAPGGGYWLVASDGGVFSFGAARFHGSTGAIHLAKPIVGMAATRDGNGYWLVASDGGVFSFGSAHYLGSPSQSHPGSPIAGLAAAPQGAGYWVAAVDGNVYSYGASRYGGGLTSGALSAANATVASIIAAPGGGYWLLPVALPPLPPAPPVLSEGSTGPAVTALQGRLLGLGYWVDTTSGVFDDSTQQAVYALQKAAGISADGTVGPETWAALAAGALPHPRSASGYVIEVNLTTDLVMVVTNGHIDYVLNTSTGGGYTFDDGGAPQQAITPQGQFQIYNAVDGLVVDSLGALWRPRYFTGGYAIHGDSYVPPVPVSHGCVRVSDEAINWIWANDIAPIGTTVWVYS